MKEFREKLMAAMLMLSFSVALNAQTTSDETDELYTRKHMCLSGFAKLGVNEKYYVKTMGSVNYADNSKLFQTVKFNGIDYVDNGKGYDLLAGDGIMTAVVLATYQPGESIIAAGQYQPVAENVVVVDDQFQHGAEITGRLISFSCRVTWVSCNNKPKQERELCRLISWPFNGGWELTDCRVTVGF